MQWTLVVIACFVAVVGVFTLYAGWLGCCCGLVFDAACCDIVLFFLSWLLVVLLIGCGWISFVLLLVVGFWVCVGGDCACFCDFWISVLWIVCGWVDTWFGFGWFWVF